MSAMYVMTELLGSSMNFRKPRLFWSAMMDVVSLLREKIVQESKRWKRWESCSIREVLGTQDIREEESGNGSCKFSDT